MIILLALLIGLVAGLRAFTPLALVSWAARLGWLQLQGTWLSFFGSAFTPWLFTFLALFELIVVDQAPSTPSRRVPTQFIARLASGALCGGALAVHAGMLITGMVIGAVGAVVGTLGGAAVRERLAQRLGRDRPAALLEDVVAIALGVLVAVTFA